MPTLPCLFCDRSNPSGAKFCNACGSPMNLKPCRKCDAVNESTATVCYQCGAPISSAEPALAASPATVPLAAEAAALSDQDRRSLPESTADIVAKLGTPAAPRVSRTGPHATDVASGTAGDWSGHLLGARSVRHSVSAASLASLIASERRSMLSRALLTSAIVAGVTVSVYYAYRNPSGIGNWLDARTVHAGLAGVHGRVNSDVASTSPSIGASSENASDSASRPSGQPSAPQSADRVDASLPLGRTESEGGIGPAANDVSDATAVAAPRTVDAVPAMPAPAEVSEAMTPPQAAAPSSAPAVRTNRAARQADRGPETAPTAGHRTRTARGERQTERRPREDPIIARCTAAVAALGLCDPRSHGTANTARLNEPDIAP